MDASEIEVFLTLAEELHFTRTAQRLHLPQPRVSRLVASLERRVGCTLFDRTSRRVTLTPIGRRLLDRAGPAWSELQAALGEAQAEARCTDGGLRLGVLVTTGGPALSRLAELFSTCHPGCDLTLHEVATVNPYGSLRRGDIDVLVNWLVVDEPDLTAGPAIEYRDRVVIVGRDHRLGARKSVSIEDLADEEVHENHPTYPQALFDAILPPVTPSGRPIRRTYPWRSVDDVVTLVARGRIVHPGMAGVPLFSRGDLVQVPIRDLPPMPLGLVWCTARENARVRALAAVARQIAPRSPRKPKSSQY